MPLRGDYDRVALFPLRLDAPAQADETVLVVGLVQDQLLQPHEAKVVERGDQTFTLAPGDSLVVDVAAAAAPQIVEHDEPAEEEERDQGEEPYDAQH
jgi:hypothetical protein